MPRTRSLPTVLACGAWLKNTACLLLDGAPAWSAVHGDLCDPVACAALEHSLQTMVAQAAAAGKPVKALAHDLHPDFFSTRAAIAFADALGVPAFGVQHHHAHIAAVVAEHGIEGPVIGLALDGVGLGTDGLPWGGELLWLDGAQWQRLGHLFPLALPGSDRAAREPWRMAASAMHALGRGHAIASRFAPQVGAAVAGGVQMMLARNLNCPATSSMGRWFDAAAGALGLSVTQNGEAEAAMALEAAAARGLAANPDTRPLSGAQTDAQNRLDLRGLMPALLNAAPDGVDAVAAGFHLALAEALATWAIHAARERSSRDVCLGGGCFFNRILRERLSAHLQAAQLRVHAPVSAGCGDAGLALGQAWAAARQLAAPATHAPTTKETETCV